MELVEKLKQIGINEKESKIYIALLESGDALASKIAKKTNINRSLTYSILDGLIEKGIVAYILKNNRRFYRAAEPDKMLAMLREKENVFQSILPQLMTLQKPAVKKPIVEVLEGKEGIKTIFNDVLRIKKEWIAFDVPGKGPETIGPAVHAFQKDRQKAKISMKVICTKTKDGEKRGKEFAAMKKSEVRYMPEKYKSPASTWVYGNRIVILYWHKELPFAIRIIDNDLAESYKAHFRVLWGASKK